MDTMVLGLVRETKSPPDRRVALTPSQCRSLIRNHPGIRILVQPSRIRCFADEEYRAEGIELSEDLGGCDVLFGIKEVDTGSLLKEKTYFFFSHTAKEQPHNRLLLKTVLEKGIRLVDYEYLTGPHQERVVAFGRWAGIVGAYNALRGWGLRNGTYSLVPAGSCRELAGLKQELRKVHPGEVRIVLTGGGRVAGGAMEVLDAAGIIALAPGEFLAEDPAGPRYTRLDPWHYVRRKGDRAFDFEHFVRYPGDHENGFAPYASRASVYIACHFWDPRAPNLLSREDLSAPSNTLELIADISCDINGPIHSTLRPSTNSDPFYGYDPRTGTEREPFAKGCITVMAVDNLPGELPRDASGDFGSALLERVMPELIGVKEGSMLQKATIAENGALTPPFGYLKDFVDQL